MGHMALCSGVMSTQFHASSELMFRSDLETEQWEKKQKTNKNGENMAFGLAQEN